MSKDHDEMVGLRNLYVKDVDLSDMLFPTVHLRLLDRWAKGIQNT